LSDKELAASCRLMKDVGHVMRCLTAALRQREERAPAQSPVPLMKRRRALIVA
jgi:hypothetical protein